MRPNSYLTFPLSGFSDFAQIMRPPRGELLNLGLNPYTGQVVMCWQDNPEARFAIRLIISQLSECVDIFDSEELPGYPRAAAESLYSAPLVSYDNSERLEHV